MQPVRTRAVNFSYLCRSVERLIEIRDNEKDVSARAEIEQKIDALDNVIDPSEREREIMPSGDKCVALQDAEFYAVNSIIKYISEYDKRPTPKKEEETPQMTTAPKHFVTGNRLCRALHLWNSVTDHDGVVRIDLREESLQEPSMPSPNVNTHDDTTSRSPVADQMKQFTEQVAATGCDIKATPCVEPEVRKPAQSDEGIVTATNPLSFTIPDTSGEVVTPDGFYAIQFALYAATGILYSNDAVAAHTGILSQYGLPPGVKPNYEQVCAHVWSYLANNGGLGNVPNATAPVVYEKYTIFLSAYVLATTLARITDHEEKLSWLDVLAEALNLRHKRGDTLETLLDYDDLFGHCAVGSISDAVIVWCRNHFEVKDLYDALQTYLCE